MFNKCWYVELTGKKGGSIFRATLILNVYDFCNHQTSLIVLVSFFEDNNALFVIVLRCFGTVFRRPYRYFSIALKLILSLSDRYKIFTSENIARLAANQKASTIVAI